MKATRWVRGALCASFLLLAAVAPSGAWAVPTVNIAVTPASVEEGETFKFTISRDGSTSSPLENVAMHFPQFGPYVCDDTRCPVTYLRPEDHGYECAIFPGITNHRCFTIPAGKNSITIDVPTYATTRYETDLQVGFFIRGGFPQYPGANHYTIVKPARIYATVRDGPDVTTNVRVTLSTPDNRAAEGDSSDTATVSLALTGADVIGYLVSGESRGLIAGESLKVPCCSRAASRERTSPWPCPAVPPVSRSM